MEVEEGGGEGRHTRAGRHEPQHGPSGRRGVDGGGQDAGRQGVQDKGEGKRLDTEERKKQTLKL